MTKKEGDTMKSQISSFSNQSLSSLNEDAQSSQESQSATMFAMNSNTVEYPVIRANEMSANYEMFVQRDIKDLDLKRSNKGQNRHLAEGARRAQGRKNINYNLLIQQELKKLNQMQREKQTTPVIPPSSLSLHDERQKAKIVNNSNVMMQTATFQNDSAEHKVLRPHKTVKQSISNKHQKAKKKSTTSKNHHN